MRSQRDQRSPLEHPLHHLLSGLSFIGWSRVDGEVLDEVREERHALDFAEVTTDADASTGGEGNECGLVKLANETLRLKIVWVRVVLGIVI